MGSYDKSSKTTKAEHLKGKESTRKKEGREMIIEHIKRHEIKKEIRSQLCANFCVLREVTATKQLKCH